MFMLEEIKMSKKNNECLNTRYSSDQDVGQIISSLSHELRTPLSIISSNLQLLKSNSLDLDSELRSETFLLCEEALASVTHFLDDIHLLNIANKGELKKKPTLININKLIEQIVNQPNTSYYKSNRIKVNANITKTLFYSDERLLNRIISGLLDNAFKFSAKEVTLTVMNDDRWLNIEIEDKGFGIPEEKIELIFKPFYRCENVKMINGSGLGLSIVQKAVECLNGKISIESIVSKNTKVKLKIPSDDEC